MDGYGFYNENMVDEAGREDLVQMNGEVSNVANSAREDGDNAKVLGTKSENSASINDAAAGGDDEEMTKVYEVAKVRIFIKLI